MIIRRCIQQTRSYSLELIRENTTKAKKLVDIFEIGAPSFYKYKHAQPTPHKINLQSPYLLRQLASGLVGNLSKFYLNFLSKKIHIRNYETLLHFIEGRTKDQALITYQNHASTLDDPLLWGCLPQRILLNPNLMRWSLAAREIIFKNPVYNTFFEAGQIIPTVRGDGIYQPAIEASIKLLNDGKWVNIYPEGKVNQGKELLGFKWGIGRLVQETKKELIILPIYHSGMVGILPLNEIKLPRPFKSLVVTVGDPIYVNKLLKDDLKFMKLTKAGGEDAARSYITKILQQKLEIIKNDTLDWMKQNNVETYFK